MLIFGKENAIETLSKIMYELSHQQIPTEAKTTYNFGKIEGGTTINAIASTATLLYEYRSSMQSCLDIMGETISRNCFSLFKCRN